MLLMQEYHFSFAELDSMNVDDVLEIMLTKTKIENAEVFADVEDFF